MHKYIKSRTQTTFTHSRIRVVTNAFNSPHQKDRFFFFFNTISPVRFSLFPPPLHPPTHSLLTHLYPNHGTLTTTVLGSRRGRRTVETGGARKKGDSIPENRGVGRGALLGNEFRGAPCVAGCSILRVPRGFDSVDHTAEGAYGK